MVSGSFDDGRIGARREVEAGFPPQSIGLVRIHAMVAMWMWIHSSRVRACMCHFVASVVMDALG